MLRKNKIIFYSLTTITIMILIFAFSAQNADESSKLSEGFISTIIGRILRVLPQFGMDYEFIIRKYAHIFEYFCLGLSTFMLLHEIKPGKSLFPAAGTEIICYIYSCTDEFHQTFVPGRSGKIVDTFVDSIGFTAAVIILVICFYIHNKRKKV